MRAGVGEFRLADSDAVRLKQQLEALELAKATSIEKQVKLSGLPPVIKTPQHYYQDSSTFTISDARWEYACRRTIDERFFYLFFPERRQRDSHNQDGTQRRGTRPLFLITFVAGRHTFDATRLHFNTLTNDITRERESSDTVAYILRLSAELLFSSNRHMFVL